MYNEVLYRIRTAPTAHLGRRSLVRLQAFHCGYSLFPKITKAEDFATDQLRDWVVTRYAPSGAEAKDAIQVLLDIAEDDGHAYELFFAALDTVAASAPKQERPPNRSACDSDPLPVSGYLDALAGRPYTFLRRLSVGALRAFIDGYCVAAVEEGFRQCADLEGFEHWVRERLDLKGLFRWEDALLARFNGDETRAFHWALDELKAYRASKGPLSERRFEIVNLGNLGGANKGVDADAEVQGQGPGETGSELF